MRPHAIGKLQKAIVLATALGLASGVPATSALAASGSPVMVAETVMKTHKIRSGETLSHLAYRYGTTVSAIARANGIDSESTLNIGQVLKIPVVVKNSTQVSKPATEEQPAPAETAIYIVIKGDTLSEIASRNQTTANAIASLNKMSLNAMIKPGQQLKIPVKSAPVAAAPAEPKQGAQEAPATTQLAATQPAATNVATQPAATNVATQPAATEPAATQPVATQSAATTAATEAAAPQPAAPQPVAPQPAAPSSEEQQRRAETLASRSTRPAVAMAWADANKIWPKGAKARVTDVKTGESFMIYRQGGTLHADVEPVTKNDTEIMKRVWGGWSWTRRAVVFEYDGYRIAGSMNGMPHGRDTIGNNGMQGQVCLHFLNSRVHRSNRVDADHQKAVKEATGK